MPRIELITEKSQLEPERHAEFDVLDAIQQGVRGPFAVLLHSPGLAELAMQLTMAMRAGSMLTSHERELAIISVTREKDARYEWSAHVTAARAAGVSDNTIEIVRHRGDLSDLSSQDRPIVAFVRELLRSNRVSDETFATLRDAHSSRWIVELAAVVGHYQFVSAINNTFEMPPKDGPDQLPIAD